MKANKAPEKIYVSNYSSELTYNWHNKRLAVKDIEYIRTDAFIEKVKKWFEKQPEQYDANGVRCYSTEDFEDFVNYMRGG